MDLMLFDTSVRFHTPWTSLKNKNEYKINTNEFYLYQTLVDEVSLLALALGLNFKLAEVLAKIHGFVFVPNGIAGWNAIKEVFIERKLDINIKKLKAELAKRMTSSINKELALELAPYIDEMFGDNILTPEVKLVLECYKILKTLQPLKNKSVKFFFELEEKIMKDLKEQCLKNGRIEMINIKTYLPLNMPQHVTNLLEEDLKEVKDEYNDILNGFINDYPDAKIEDCVLWATSYYIQY